MGFGPVQSPVPASRARSNIVYARARSLFTDSGERESSFDERSRSKRSGVISTSGTFPSSARKCIIEVQTVLLVALLALARKFIILDLHEYDGVQILALGGVVLALGVTYWLVRDRDARSAGR
jgi:Phosphate-starvation-inducible E family